MTDQFRELNELGLWDFKVDSYHDCNAAEDSVLVLLGSRDFSYYHDAEIRFVGVELINLPTTFHHAVFAELNPVEIPTFRRFSGRIFRIVSDHGDECEQHGFVVAEQAIVTVATVRYTPPTAAPSST